VNIDLVLLILVSGVCRAYHNAFFHTATTMASAMGRTPLESYGRVDLLPAWVSLFTLASVALMAFTFLLGAHRFGFKGVILTYLAFTACTWLARFSLPKVNTPHYQTPCLQKLANRFKAFVKAGDLEKAKEVRWVLIRAGNVAELPASISNLL
jgi:hypothetical protein